MAANPYFDPVNLFGYKAPVPPTTVLGGPTGATPLPGGPVSGYDPSYGGVPSAPNPAGSLADALKGNLGSLGDLYNLSTGTSGASAAGALTQLLQNLPGAQGMLNQSSTNISDLLGGNIPKDVVRRLSQLAAERGVNIGSPDSANSMASLIQSLGLTSLGLTQAGENELTAAIGRTPTGPKFDPSTMLINPQLQLIYQWLANQLGAAPIPGAAGRTNLNALLGGARTGAGAGGPGGYTPPYTPPAFTPPPAPFVGGTPSPPPYVPGGSGETQADVLWSLGIDPSWLGMNTLTQSPQGFDSLYGSPIGTAPLNPYTGGNQLTTEDILGGGPFGFSDLYSGAIGGTDYGGFGGG